MKKTDIKFNYNLRPSDPALFRQACDFKGIAFPVDVRVLHLHGFANLIAVSIICLTMEGQLDLRSVVMLLVAIQPFLGSGEGGAFVGVDDGVQVITSVL